MPDTTLKFTVTVSTEPVDLVDVMEIVRTLLDRMRAGDVELGDGRVVKLKVDVDMQEAAHTIHDPAKAFRAGAQEAQDRPLREGLLNPRQFPTDEP